MAPPLNLKNSAGGTVLRRKEERHSVSTGVKVFYRGVSCDAVIVDISPGGLRLDGTFGLMVSDAIVVRLPTGYEVAGRVAWSLGAMVGVEYTPHLRGENADFRQLTKLLGVTIPLAAPPSGREDL